MSPGFARHPRFPQAFRSRYTDQRGDAIVLLASLAVGLAITTALGADLGRIYYLRTRMQVATDAAALAGAEGLATSQAEGTQQALAMANANGFPISAADVTFPPENRCQVRISRPQPLFLAKLLHVDQISVGASSTAELTEESQTRGARPFGVPDTDFVLGHCVNPGREYTFKTAANPVLHGDFQPLAIDGPGYRDYLDAILHGARQTVHVGDVLDVQEGDMSEATVDGIDQLVGDDETPYDEAVAHPRQTPRVIDVPLIAPRRLRLDGRTVVRVTGIGHFYITYAESGQVFGRFVGTATDPDIVGSQASDSVKLVE